MDEGGVLNALGDFNRKELCIKRSQALALDHVSRECPGLRERATSNGGGRFVDNAAI